MAKESYTRWRSGACDEDNDEGVDEASEGESGSVTIITKPRHNHPTPLTTCAQTRVAMVMVLLCFMSAAVGVWVGWAWGSSYLRYPLNMVVAAPKNDYNHSQPLLSHLRPNMIKEYIRKISKTPVDHLATKVEGEWKEQGFETTTTTFTVDLSRPDPRRPNTIEITTNTGTRTVITHAPEDPHALPYIAYSPAGTASGPLVYGHYGLRSDLSILQFYKIPLKGCILLLRHGKLNTGHKVHQAEEAGAAGVLLYPDPVDTSGGDPYPNGTRLPDDGVLWETLTVTPGDPSTPHLPSLPYMYRRERTAQRLPGIPVESVNAATAKQLFTLMAGPEAPEAWFGGVTQNLTLGGSWSDVDIDNLTLTVNNIIKRQKVKNIHATMPASDEARVVMVGCHYGSPGGQGHSSAGVGALLALSNALAKIYLPRGTQRKVIFSAWAAGEGGMLGSTEFTQLHPWWVESSLIAYLGMDDLVQGKGAMQVSASPALREAIREAARQVSWPKGSGELTIDVRNGWRLSDPVRMQDVYFHNLGSVSDYVSFTAQRGVPSAHFATVSADWKSTHAFHHTQYDDYDAHISWLDPTMEWTTMITSLVGATLLVVSESEAPPLLLTELSGDLYNGWQLFLKDYSESLFLSNYNFKDILGAIEREILVLENSLTVLDEWYHARPFYVRPYPQHYPGEEHWRQVEQRLWWLGNLERGMLGPRGLRRPCSTHLMFGPDPDDPDKSLHFPHVVTAINHALKQKASWESVHQELSYVLAALASYRQLFPGDLSGETT